MKKSIIYRTIILLSLLPLTNVWAQNVITSEDVFSDGTARFLKNFDANLMFINDFQNSRSSNLGGNANINATEAFLSSDLKTFTPMNGSFNAHFVHIQGTNPAIKIGDTQATSNIAVPETVNRMADLWYQHNFGEKVKLLAGIHDISTEFYVTDSSLNFTHASFGTGAELSVSGPHGPSLYPVTTVGLRTSVDFSDQVSLLTGIYDADPGDTSTYSSFKYKVNSDEGALLISELAYKVEKRKIGLGGWGYSVKQTHLEDETLTARSAGIYIMQEENLNDHMSVFARFGYANPRTTTITNNIVVGGIYKGILQTDLKDEIGLGISRARFSKNFLRSLNAPAEDATDEVAKADEEGTEKEPSISYKNAETAIELYYQFKPLEQILLRPDVQFVSNPSGDPANANAWVMGFRAQINL